MGLQGAASLAGNDDLRARIRHARRGAGPGDPRPAQLHLRAAPRHPGRPPARPGPPGTGRGVQQRTGVVAVAEIEPGVAAKLGGQAGDVVQLAREALSECRTATPRRRPARMSLYRDQDATVLEVDDNGRGFDPAQATGASQGLRNLRERATALGGRAEIDKHPSETGPGSGSRSPVTRAACGAETAGALWEVMRGPAGRRRLWLGRIRIGEATWARSSGRSRAAPPRSTSASWSRRSLGRGRHGSWPWRPRLRVNGCWMRPAAPGWWPGWPPSGSARTAAWLASISTRAC